MVADIITQNRDAIATLCRTYRVRALWAFGSVTTDHWDPTTSDIDLLVDLGHYDDGVVIHYLDLADALQALLGHPVDLISVGGLRHNHRLRAELEQTRVVVYAQQGATVSVRCHTNVGIYPRP